jgi:hypothetical protein
MEEDRLIAEIEKGITGGQSEEKSPRIKKKPLPFDARPVTKKSTDTSVRNSSTMSPGLASKKSFKRRPFPRKDTSVSNLNYDEFLEGEPYKQRSPKFMTPNQQASINRINQVKAAESMKQQI